MESQVEVVSEYGSESSEVEPVTFIEKKKVGKVEKTGKPNVPKAETMIGTETITSNPYQQAKHEQAKVERAEKKIVKGIQMKVVKVFEQKKTVKDSKGETWEVTDKRDKKAIEKPVESDSDAGSELSFD